MDFDDAEAEAYTTKPPFIGLHLASSQCPLTAQAV